MLVFEKDLARVKITQHMRPVVDMKNHCCIFTCLYLLLARRDTDRAASETVFMAIPAAGSAPLFVRYVPCSACSFDIIQDICCQL